MAAPTPSSVGAAPSLEWIGSTVSFLAVSAGLGCRACCSVMPGVDVDGFV